MAVYRENFDETIISLLRGGGIGVLRTDTIYGIVARANNCAAVNRVFEVKRRSPTKPPISLISHSNQLLDDYDSQTLAILARYWPGKNTIILPTQNSPEWLSRGTRSISYRLPALPVLTALIDQTGPLVAPSANPEGQEPATTIDEAIAYFGDVVDFYVDSGKVTDNVPSKVYRLRDYELEQLR